MKKTEFCPVACRKENSIDFSKTFGYNKLAIKSASVAQSVVHLTRNEKVACSSHVTSSRTGSVLLPVFVIKKPSRKLFREGILIPLPSLPESFAEWRADHRRFPGAC